MRRILHVLLPCIFIFNGLVAAQEDVLFSVGDTPVKKSEFEYIYKKNNFNNRADYSEKSLKDYLGLYINFRLKVKEALDQGLDKSERFTDELESYERQLLDSYLDKEILDKLVRTEYERSKTDLNISHIFFAASPDGNTDAAYAKALEASGKIKAGVGFEEVVSVSEDAKTVSNAGRLGWFNSYQIGLPEVEEAIYALKVGEVSEPVKSRVGYHILKLNETRPARPKLKASIIKRFFPLGDTSAAGKKIAEDTIKMAYAQLKNNVPFEKVVQQYSEDELTKQNQGQLDWFGINTYAKTFEETVYSLKDGEISAPFRTSTAWYIIKRQETAKALTFEESVPVLKSKLQSLPQYQYEMDRFIDKLKVRFSIKEFKENIAPFKQRLAQIAKTMPFVYRDTVGVKNLLQIGTKVYNENDYGQEIVETFYKVNPKAGMDKYDALIKNTTQNLILGYYKNSLKETSQEYKLLMDEYRNGIMIFTLSEKNIWDKASEDSAGLMAYYKEHTADFNLKKRATVRTITVVSKKDATAIYKMLAADKGLTDEMLKEKLKKSGAALPEISSEVLDITRAKVDISAESLTEPVLENGIYKITQVSNIQPEKARAFQECRGYVVAAYQEYLEKKWLEDLKKKYPVTISNEVFQSLVKK